MNVYKLTASQLDQLLQILGALVADYVNDPDGKLSPDLVPFLNNSVLQWKELPSLQKAITAAKSGKEKMQALYDVGVELQQSLTTFQNNKEYTYPELGLLKEISTYLRNDSPRALAKIKSDARFFGSPGLAKYFIPEVTKTDHKELKKVVKDVVGREDVALSNDEAALLKETDPESFAAYSALRKEHTKNFSAALTSYVRSSGKPHVPYAEAYKTLVAMGYTRSMLPGFTGLIDDKGNWYTANGKSLASKPTLGVYVKVEMNPKPGPDSAWICKGVKKTGEVATYYTTDYANIQSALKYQHVKELAEAMPKIRAKWFEDVKHFDQTNPMSVAAVVLEILYEFAARVGSQPGRGVGTLLVGNASVTTTGINLAYNGKDSIPTKHMLKHSDPYQEHVIAALLTLLEGKSKKDRIFTITKGNRQVLCSPSKVNEAFHHYGASSEVTVHKIRTFRANKAFVEVVERDAGKTPPKDIREATARWLDLCAEVGKVLNHKRGVGTEKESITGLTAAKSYIDTGLQIDLWNKWGLRTPKQLEDWSKTSEDD